MTETYVREHLDDVDLNTISYYNVFSMDFIRQFKDQIDVECTLLYGKDIPKEFWREMGYDPDCWYDISEMKLLHPKKL